MVAAWCWPPPLPTAWLRGSTFRLLRGERNPMTDRYASPAVPRRTALKAGLAAGLTGLLLPGLGGCTPDDRPDAVTVAGGEPGGFYLEFAGLLAESLQRHGVAGRAT